MKLKLLFMAAAMALLAGCGQKSDPQFLKCEQRLTLLESNVTELFRQADNRWKDVTNLQATARGFMNLEQTNLRFAEALAVEIGSQNICMNLLQMEITNLQASIKMPVVKYYSAPQKSVMPASVATQIRAGAEREWPGDYRMQAYEITKQTEAWYKLHP